MARPRFRKWTPAEDQILRADYSRLGLAGCPISGRSRGAVQQRASELGLASSLNRAAEREYDHACNELKAIRPGHLAGTNVRPFTDEWFASCNSAFVDRMRAVHPEKEVWK
jgi:hypothetical protein